MSPSRPSTTGLGQELIDTGQKSGLSSIESAELAAGRRRIAELESELASATRSTEIAEVDGGLKGDSKRSKRWPKKDYPYRPRAACRRCPSPGSTSGETAHPRKPTATCLADAADLRGAHRLARPLRRPPSSWKNSSLVTALQWDTALNY